MKLKRSAYVWWSLHFNGTEEKNKQYYRYILYSFNGILLEHIIMLYYIIYCCSLYTYNIFIIKYHKYEEGVNERERKKVKAVYLDHNIIHTARRPQQNIIISGFDCMVKYHYNIIISGRHFRIYTFDRTANTACSRYIQSDRSRLYFYRDIDIF